MVHFIVSMILLGTTLIALGIALEVQKRKQQRREESRKYSEDWPISDDHRPPTIRRSL